ncbi:MAG: glucosylceramidase [Herbinix sp.]|jgi:glucosylceramidase|nr:glucosylceramidase [Herbinix sp.]
MKAEWIYTTYDGLSTDTKTILVESTPDLGQENKAVNLHPEYKYQTFEGFGASLTEAAAFTWHQMPKTLQEEFIEACFSESGLNYTQARMSLDSCDACLSNYSAMEDEKDSKLNSFSIKRDEEYVLPFAAAINEGIKEPITVMLSPWSPPPFMKTNGEKNHGGKLKKEYQELWAEYFCRYIKEYRNHGINVKRISIQNEPAAVQRWDSCIYSAQEEKEFLRDYLYPALQQHSLTDLEIYIWDHNKERAVERALTIIDQDTDYMISGIAFHWYSGDHFEALSMLRERFPGKKLIFSEGCVEYSKFSSGNQLANARMYGHDIIGDLNGGAQAFIAWTILFNSEGGPNHVNNLCEAPIMYDLESKTMEKKLCYTYIGHFSKYIVPGSIRIGMSKFTDKLDVTAFERPDGTLAVVIMNRTDEEMTVYLRLQQELLELNVPRDSIGTALLS